MSVVTLVTDGEPPYAVATTRVGTYADLRRLRTAGVDRYVAGPRGTVWVL